MKSNKTVHLYIEGACGNQFFQYAFARHIQEIVGGKLVINYRKVRNDKSIWAGSDNLLRDFNTVNYEYTDRFGIDVLIYYIIKYIRVLLGLSDFDKRTFSFFNKLASFLPKYGIYYYDAAYFPFEVCKANNIYIHGFFESARYFEGIDNKIKKELTPKQPLLETNQELFSIIQNTESVCITIKRQDIDNPGISDIYDYDISYFYTGIDYIKRNIEDPVFIIFSDDIEWCKKNLDIDGSVYYESGTDPIWEKIRLMSACKHFIIHNSTFSWWVQHLSSNPDKIVLAPVKWMQRDDQPIDIYEDNWLYITPNGEIVKEHEDNMK